MLNDNVTVTAAPAENYNFIGWFADPSSEEPISTELEYTFTVSADTPATLTAKFAATYQLDVSVSPEGTGTVVGTGAYPGGSVVTVGASPAQDWRFSGWYRWQIFRARSSVPIRNTVSILMKTGR